MEATLDLKKIKALSHLYNSVTVNLEFRDKKKNDENVKENKRNERGLRIYGK